jgi:hypothetical protein
MQFGREGSGQKLEFNKKAAAEIYSGFFCFLSGD